MKHKNFWGERHEKLMCFTKYQKSLRKTMPFMETTYHAPVRTVGKKQQKLRGSTIFMKNDNIHIERVQQHKKLMCFMKIPKLLQKAMLFMGTTSKHYEAKNQCVI